MIIKQCSLDSIDAILSLITSYPKETLLKSFGFIPTKAELLRQTFDDPDFKNEYFLNLFHEDNLVGTVIAVHRDWKNGTTAHIKFLFTDNKSENVGETLLAEVEKRLKNNNVKEVVYASSSPFYWSFQTLQIILL